MDSSSPASPNQPGSAPRGRGGSRGRGNRGKNLRARGRRGTGRPAEWKPRLLLEGEGPEDEDDEEAREARDEMRRKYAKRQLGSNADRYQEEEPELNSDGTCSLHSEPIWVFLIARYWHTGEEIKEPEVDLSDFLARQRLDDAAGSSSLKPTDEPDEDEVDHSLAHLNSAGIQSAHRPTKGRVQMIEWDEELENMSREKAIADANRGE